jgi:hypothetical protein
MTIASEDARSGPYNGNGSTTVFAYDFKALDQAHLVVTLKSSLGVETVQTITTHYSVSGVGDEGGGNVTMVTPPASGQTLTITRSVPLTQGVDLQNRGGVQPNTLETAYDRLTQISQDTREVQQRTVKFPVSSLLSGIEMPGTATNNAVISWNSSGTALVNGPTSTEISNAESNATAAAASATAAVNSAAAFANKYTFSTTTSMADPGTGIIRFNNATYSSVTAIAIDDQTADTNNPDISPYIVTWDDSTGTVKGYLHIFEDQNPGNFAIFTISALTDNSGWSELAVSHLASNGTIDDTDPVRVQFNRNGDTGATGATGPTGATGATGPTGPVSVGLLLALS